VFVWVNVLDSDFGIRVILMDCQSTNCYNVWWHLTEVHPVALEASLGYTGALSILFSEKHIVRLTNYVKVKGSSTLSRRLHSSAPQKSSTEYRPRCYMAWAHIAPYLPSQLRNKYQHQNEFSGEPFHFSILPVMFRQVKEFPAFVSKSTLVSNAVPNFVCV
jgi:hypothetical protein